MIRLTPISTLYPYRRSSALLYAPAVCLLFFLMIRRPPRSTLLPYRRSSDLLYAPAVCLPLARALFGALDVRDTQWLGVERVMQRDDVPRSTLRSMLNSHLVLLSMLRNVERDRKSTRLNSSHSQISYAVFCLK